MTQLLDYAAAVLVCGPAAYYLGRVAGSALPQAVIGAVGPLARFRARSQTAWEAGFSWPGFLYCSPCRNFYLTALVVGCWLCDAEWLRWVISAAAAAGVASAADLMRRPPLTPPGEQN